MVQQNQKIEKKKRMLLALPVLVLPFVTLMFWALGGGSGNKALANEVQKGFNAELPGANNKDEPVDKMGFYAQAEKDELERTKKEKSDPYYNMEFDSAENPVGDQSDLQIVEAAPVYQSSRSGPDERKVYSKLHALQAVLNQSEKEPANIDRPASTPSKAQGVEEDLDRLEQMMQNVNAPGTEDPQMKQANELLESILDLQHPERVQQRLKSTSQQNRGNVYAVSASQSPDPISQLAANNTMLPLASGFFGLENPYEQQVPINPAIRAVVHETQTLVSGSVIKLRLLDAVYINGIYIPKDQFVFGEVSLSGERLNITINSMRASSQLFPVELNVYDMDGMEGIYIPGAISRDVAKQGGERSIQGMGIMSLDPSLSAQAANAGIEITKNLLSKKVKLVKVQVKAGYQIMLLDNKQNKNK